MSDDPSSDFASVTTTSETCQENTQQNVNLTEDDSVYTLGILDSNENVSEENDRKDSFEIREDISLEKDGLSSSEDEGKELTVHLSESSTEFDKKDDERKSELTVHLTESFTEFDKKDDEGRELAVHLTESLTGFDKKDDVGKSELTHLSESSTKFDKKDDVGKSELTVHLTESLTEFDKKNDEGKELTVHLSESSTEFDKDDVGGRPLDNKDKNSFHTKADFFEILGLTETKKIMRSDSTEVEQFIKKEEQINDNELNEPSKVHSNNLECTNDCNLRWQSASSPAHGFRRWDSDPEIEREADVPLKEEQRLPVIYRLSLRFSKVFPRNIEKIPVDSSVDKAGFLQKLSGRGFPYLNQWKRRYCVLTKGRLYLYEKESSEKCASVIDLKYFDHVTEALQKESKKVSNVFVVTSQDRSFFDPGRHLFAADTLTEMHDWIAKLRESIELIRNNNRPTKGGKTQPSKRDSQGLPTEEKQQQNQNLCQRSQQQGTDVSVASTDIVDGRVVEAQEEFKSKQEFTSSLKKKLKIESPDAKSDEEISETEILKNNDEKNSISPPNIPSVKKVSSTTISLQNPNLSLDAKPQLESITKNRIRGPAGRRAPQSRRTILKERASSMSALQQEGLTDNDSRETEDLDEDSEEVRKVSIEPVPLNSSQPVLAYHYSSDEDSPSETECYGSDRTMKQSNSTGKKDHQKCSKISFNLDDEYRHSSVKKSMPKSHIPFSSKLPSANFESVSEDFLDFRSLPRSLARESNRKKANILNKGLQITAFSGSASSEGRLSTGRASPEMDALDNLLMNRSVQTNMSLNQADGCLSDQEGSETSTFKGVQEEQLDKNEELLNEAEELKQALGRFSSTMQHLQHHTAELENRTKQIEYEFKVSKNDIIHLQETTEGIHSEVKKLSAIVSSITQEASKAKKEYVLQRQETEKLQNDVSETLYQARRSQLEYEKLKGEYDLSLKDLQSLIASIRSSFDMTDDRKPIQKMEERKQTERTTLTEVGKSYSEDNKAILCKEPKVEDNQKSSHDKKNNKDGTINQKGGYQSFFQRPTSLIYGLTSKACNKPFNNKKEKDEKSPVICKVDKEEKKKHKDEKQNSKQTERKHKQTKKNEQQTCSVESEIKATPKQDKHSEKFDHYEKRNYPGFSIENLPMMDDQTDSLERKSDYTRSGSPYISHTIQNFGLEKSLSSPTVLAKFSNSKHSRPQELCILPTTKETYKSTSNNSSPDSPTSPSITTLPFQSSCQISPREARIKPETMFPNQPSNLQGMSRQSSEEKLVNRHRQGVFAITRQRSSPNIPVQRQSSGPLYPLQRQNSLGTVPEEGQLPRQASLMSVPENRPIVDQTLPLSPSSSMLSFGLSVSPSGDRLDNLRDRYSARNSMELVTGPVLSGSLIQELQARELPSSSEFHINEFPMATSSIKKTSTKRISTETLIL